MRTDIWETYGYVPASTSGTLITSPTTANTMGAWTQLGQVTAPAGIDLIEIDCGYVSQNVNMLIDIGIGPSGSQIVRIPSLVLYNYGTGGRQVIRFPLFFPPGALIWARCQAWTTTATTVQVMARGRYHDGSRKYCTSVVAYGVNAANSDATGLSLGGNAFNSTSFGNSTALHRKFIVEWHAGDYQYAIQMLAGSFIAIDTTVVLSVGGVNFLCFPTSVESGDLIVPAGTALSMNGSTTGAGSSNSYLNAIIYGLS